MNFPDRNKQKSTMDTAILLYLSMAAITLGMSQLENDFMFNSNGKVDMASAQKIVSLIRSLPYRSELSQAERDDIWLVAKQKAAITGTPIIVTLDPASIHPDTERILRSIIDTATPDEHDYNKKSDDLDSIILDMEEDGYDQDFIDRYVKRNIYNKQTHIDRLTKSLSDDGYSSNIITKITNFVNDNWP